MRRLPKLGREIDLGEVVDVLLDHFILFEDDDLVEQLLILEVACQLVDIDFGCRKLVASLKFPDVDGPCAAPTRWLRPPAWRSRMSWPPRTSERQRQSPGGADMRVTSATSRLLSPAMMHVREL
jgi:hypothetical protein